MSFFAAFAAFWKGYADFTGRSSRSAYWWVVLALVLLNIIIGIVFPGREVTLDPGSGLDPITYYESSLVSTLFAVVILLPNIAITVRRLRDAGKSPHRIWWFLLPIIGWIMLLVWLCAPTKAAREEQA